MTRKKAVRKLPPINPNSCPILERTGDGRSAGRCWYFCKDDICPRHGDVSKELTKYRTTGELTDENDRKATREEWSEYVWAWYLEGDSIQGDGFATRADAIRDAVEHEADPKRLRVGIMRTADAADTVNAEEWVEGMGALGADRLCSVTRMLDRATEQYNSSVDGGSVHLVTAFSTATGALRDWVNEYVTLALRPGAQEALEQWARENMSPYPQQYCDGDEVEEMKRGDT